MFSGIECFALDSFTIHSHFRFVYDKLHKDLLITPSAHPVVYFSFLPSSSLVLPTLLHRHQIIESLWLVWHQPDEEIQGRDSDDEDRQMNKHDVPIG